MAATKDDIRLWLNSENTPMGNEKEDCTHMLVVCDTFDYDVYPVFVTKDQNVGKVIAEHDGKNMQTVMEVYSFSQKYTVEGQLDEHRAWHID